MRLRHKSWAEDMIKAHPEYAFNKDAIENGSLPSFSMLEIGSGCGEFLIKKALNDDKHVYLGVEVNRTAFAISIKKMAALEVVPSNIYYLNGDVHKLLPLIPKESLDVIFLNFNDPWPKKKHFKRRMSHPLNLAIYYDLLKKGGKVLLKTDNDIYYEASKEYFVEFDKFKYTFIDDYEVLEEDDQESEYEMKFRSIGKPIHRIVGIKE